MATIGSCNPVLSTDGSRLTFTATVNHPLREAGSWFVDTAILVARDTEVWRAEGAPRQVDPSATADVAVSVAPPSIDLVASWEPPFAITLTSEPCAPTAASEHVIVPAAVDLPGHVDELRVLRTRAVTLYEHLSNSARPGINKATVHAELLVQVLVELESQ